MRQHCLVLLLILLGHANSAQAELTYAQAHALRLSAIDKTDEWVIPFSRDFSEPHFQFETFATSNPETISLVKAIAAQSKTIADQILNERFGIPYEAEVKVRLGYSFRKWTQDFSANAGSVASLEDPIFPIVKGMIYQDFNTSVQYLFRPIYQIYIQPRLTIGARRMVTANYTAGEILSEKPKLKLFESPMVGFTDLSLKSAADWNRLVVMFEINSLPLRKLDYEYWDTNLGLRTMKFYNVLKSIKVNTIDFYCSFSPFYSGNTLVGETMRVGTGIKAFKYLNLDIFWRDFYTDEGWFTKSEMLTPGVLLNAKLLFLDFGLFAYKKQNFQYNFKSTQVYGGHFQLVF